MKKKILSLCVVGLLAVTAVGGTLAYFTDTDGAKNVMTMGSVDIDQIEQQRNENGELEPFEDGKLMIPAVYESNTNNDTWNNPKTYGGTVNVNGKDYTIFGDDVVKNAVDKIVTVKNTGKSPAYVRTLFAFEDTDDMSAKVHYMFNDANGNGELIYFPSNGDDYLQFTAGDGATYTVGYYVYDAALAAGEVSEPSLLQIFFDKSATNEDVAKAGDTYEIYVLSQAVQSEGFDNADDALNEAFGEITYDKDDMVKEWFAAIPELF